jgi:urease accessory protein
MRKLLPTTILAAFPLAAWAHTADDATSAFDGLLHPLMGPDHLLAMLSVGIVSVLIGGRAVIWVPTAFVASMLAGGTIGVLGTELPHVELGIILSVLLLGIAIAVVRRFPVWLAMAVVAMFGAFHGNAHGLEMPEAHSPVFYSLGFSISTVAIHLLGVGIGFVPALTARGRAPMTVLGAAISAAGVVFLVRLGS